MVSKQELIDFEEEIKDLFLAKKILSPIHLSRGNEEQLIEIFEQVKDEDWVLSTHRSHYHALLKGISPEWLRNEILENRSIHIYNKEHNFFSSAIVGGICPIAVGIAMGIKIKNESVHVWAFVGDMAAETGIFHECTKYAENFDLPITFVVENNEFSTDVPTKKVWGKTKANPGKINSSNKIVRYSYERVFPHVGCGKWVEF